jgi:hypothetical protein
MPLKSYRLTAYSFMHRPLITEPPIEPLPHPPSNAQWYGETWLKYPQDHILSPSYFPHVFKAKCQLRLIMNRVCQEVFSEGSSMTLEQANELGSQLRVWYVSLPEPLLAQKVVLPGHLQLQ